MPAKLTQESVDKGVAKVLIHAPDPAPEVPRVSPNDLLKEIAAYLKKLTELQESTTSLLRELLTARPAQPTPPPPPAEPISIRTGTTTNLEE